ncbi:MAG: hypothetical protein A2Y25_11540 [Candidatus Melainabacteria bacterium GWF2_37_15]|nr:MAG: hypothetical protein A2Y25_11540 [Candidatus Melainabacteria bacterium GWF2_37_15]
MTNKDFTYNTLGKTNLSVSEVGFGGYRIDIRSPLNLEALKKALVSGINLIDTSANYTNGNSELLVGEVLRGLINSQKLSRESVVIVTKGGYIQGDNYDISQQRKKKNKTFPDLVEFQKGLEHCIHPEFLQDQITKSLERLEVETIDVYLLHNPEYYLKWAKENNIDLSTARKEYYSRIKKAFEYLEKEVQKGRIKHYGISSNTFPSSSSDYDFTCLEAVLKIAEEISTDNHFSVIEFPMNLVETGNRALLELAQSKNLGVLINRPLNAFYDNKLINLAEPRVFNPPSVEQINEELKNIRKQEKYVAEKLKAHKNKKILAEVESSLFVSEELQKSWLEAKNISNWQAVLNQYFLPRFHHGKNYIKNSSLKNEELEADLHSLIYKIAKVFNQIIFYYNNEHLKLTAKIKENLANSVPELSSVNKLSNMAIRSIRSTRGVTTVLVGMTKLPYVTDVIEELKVPVNKDFNWDKIHSTSSSLNLSSFLNI